MRYQITSYIKFLLSSSNQHGIHSPFVYELTTKCFYQRKKWAEYKTLSTIRKRLRDTNETISVTDFGAGSRVFTSNERSISAIAKNAGITAKRQQLLFRLVRFLQPKQVLELGTSVGLATSALALGAPSARVLTVEGCPATMAVAKEIFEAFHLTSIENLNQTFEQFFAKKEPLKYDLVFIDGNHSKDRTLEYFKALLPYCHNETLLIFDDIYWSEAMTEAWKEISAHPTVTVSIDTYQWGLVFFRKEQPKQHFAIRL